MPARVIGVFVAELGHDGVQFRLGLLGGDAIFETRDAFGVMRSAAGGIAIEGEGRPEIDVVTVGEGVVFVAGVLGAGRHDSNDGEGLCVQGDFLSDDGGVSAESCAPEAVAEDDLLSVVREFGVAVEFAAELRMQAENAEEAGGDVESIKAYGFSGAAGELHVSAGVDGHGVEGPTAGTVVAKVEVVQGKSRIGGVREENANDFFRLRVRQRLEQDAGDDTEDGAVGSDAQGESEDDDNGESGIAAKLAERVAEILQ